MSSAHLKTGGNFATAAEAHAARLLLDSQRIPAVVVDEALVANFWTFGNAVGGIKLQVNAADFERSSQLLTKQLDAHAEPAESAAAPAWICSQCREQVPANFDVCWACTHVREPGDVAAQAPH